ncbi:MAG TPA: PhnD/SsuA/transferrin family substrate-binding protein, partial [Gallionellaceae bacterium]
MGQPGNRKSWPFLIGCLLALLAVAFPVLGQGRADKPSGPDYTTRQPAGKEYIFAVHPLHNPARLFEVYGPLIDYLNRNIPGVTFRLEASRNYEAFEEKLYGRKFGFALPNPYQTLKSLD